MAVTSPACSGILASLVDIKFRSTFPNPLQAGQKSCVYPGWKDEHVPEEARYPLWSLHLASHRERLSHAADDVEMAAWK